MQPIPSSDDPRRAIYLRRMFLGLGMLAILAIPAAVHSHAAIASLFNRPADWIPDTLRVKRVFNDFTEHFSVADVIMFAWEGSDLDDPRLTMAADILRPLCDQDEATIETLAAVDDVPAWAADWVRQTRKLCQQDRPLHWVRSGSETLDRLTSAPVSLTRDSAIDRLRGTLIGPDGEQTCLIVSANEEALIHRRALIPAIRDMLGRLTDGEQDDVAVVGAPFDGAVVDSEAIRSIRTFSPPASIIAGILCLICLRSVPMTLVIVTVAVIGQGLVLAAVYYTGVPMNAVLIVLPPLVFVLTVSAGIHLSNYYLDIASEFPAMPRGEAAEGAMRAGMLPCVLATGTTVIGLSSLLLVRLQPVRIFGGVASLGVMLTLGLLFLILPGAMVLSRRRGGANSDDANADVGAPDSGFRAGALQWMRRRLARPWPVIATFVVITLSLAAGLPRLTSTVSIPRMFLPDSDIRRQYDWFESNVAPAMNGEVLLTFPRLQADDDPLRRLAVVVAAHRACRQPEFVGGALSALTFVPPVPRGRGLRAAAVRGVVRDLISDPESSLGQLGFISRDGDREMWRISIRMPQRATVDFGSQIDEIAGLVRDAVAPADEPPRVDVTGSVVIVQSSQELLLSDLFKSFVAAFGVIAVVMMLMLRSVLGGLLAMFPNLFPTVALFGAMGLAAIPLDIGSVMSASVALGIAVDDTVHLLSRFGSRRQRGLSRIRAALGALRQCGWAMFQTTLVCGVSLMSYFFSDFVPTSRFSLFMNALLASALVGVLLLLPTMMASPLGRWLSRTVGSDAAASVHRDTPDRESPPPPSDVRRLPTKYETTTRR